MDEKEKILSEDQYRTHCRTFFVCPVCKSHIDIPMLDKDYTPILDSVKCGRCKTEFIIKKDEK